MNFVLEKIPRLMTLEPALQKGARFPNAQDYGFIADASMAVQNGKVAWVGRRQDLPTPFKKWKRKRTTGGIVMPGLVDPHTHLVYAGDRTSEFEMRLAGATYQEIAAKGGGIQSTMRATRKASTGELYRLAVERLKLMSRQGVTTVEMKTGYGLTLKDEIRCLEVAVKLQKLKIATIVKTFLGAHAIPPEYTKEYGHTKEDYIFDLAHKWIPILKKKKLLEQVDIFVDDGYFTAADARILLSAALLNGAQVKVHSDEFKAIGGTELAVDLSALSADHLLAITDHGAQKLAKSETTAVLLPTTALFLKADYAPARKLLDLGARVALGSDYNPGSSPTLDQSIVGILAAQEMGMTTVEIIIAQTLAASFALGLQKSKGALVSGHDADFIEIDAESPADLFYRFGTRLGPVAVTHKGRAVC